MSKIVSKWVFTKSMRVSTCLTCWGVPGSGSVQQWLIVEGIPDQLQSALHKLAGYLEVQAKRIMDKLQAKVSVEYLAS